PSAGCGPTAAWCATPAPARQGRGARGGIYLGALRSPLSPMSGRTLLLVTIVNACLRDGRGGSPTAVLEETWMTDVERCQVPRLRGTSPAVFVSADDGDLSRPPASLRFFTAAGELPGCGHG